MELYGRFETSLGRFQLEIRTKIGVRTRWSPKTRIYEEYRQFRYSDLAQQGEDEYLLPIVGILTPLFNVMKFVSAFASILELTEEKDATLSSRCN